MAKDGRSSEQKKKQSKNLFGALSRQSTQVVWGQGSPWEDHGPRGAEAWLVGTGRQRPFGCSDLSTWRRLVGLRVPSVPSAGLCSKTQLHGAGQECRVSTVTPPGVNIYVERGTEPDQWSARSLATAATGVSVYPQLVSSAWQGEAGTGTPRGLEYL